MNDVEVILKVGEDYSIDLTNIDKEIGRLNKIQCDEFVCNRYELGRDSDTLEDFMDVCRIENKMFEIKYTEEPYYRVEVQITFYRDKIEEDELSIVIDNNTYKIYDLIKIYPILAVREYDMFGGFDECYELENGVYMNKDMDDNFVIVFCLDVEYGFEVE